MEDLYNVIIGLGLIEIMFVILSTTRWAIGKGRNAYLWFILATITNLLAPLVLSLLTDTEKKVKRTNFENQIFEITQPFIDLTKTSRALLGLNIVYVIEGLTYFGVVTLATIYFNDFVGLDDIDAGRMVGVLTGGITIAMLILGATVDWIGLRKSLIISLIFMLAGRIFLAAAPDLGVGGLWNSAHIFAMLGILGIILGYGIFQPACYAGVKQLTNEKTSAMGYAMLYALMNLGGFLPGIISPPIRRAFEITGVFWVYAALTIVGIGVVYFIISKKAMKEALEENNHSISEEESKEEDKGFKVIIKAFKEKVVEKKKIVIYLAVIFVGLAVLATVKQLNYINLQSITHNDIINSIININWFIPVLLIGLSFVIYIITDARFSYFVFILIFVQTLFAHNWLTLPPYTQRAFVGFVSNNYELFNSLNPILIFAITPVITALTYKKDTYNMMIIGTFVMAVPTFILVLGVNVFTLLAYILIMTIGEAMWQPRFLQWVADIAPKNMTGIYMGIGQFPWFLTKVITSLYSGWFLMNYCPADTQPSEMNTQMMWLIYGFIAIVSPVGLLLAKKWMVKGFKTKHEG